MMCCQYLVWLRARTCPGRAHPGCLSEMDLSGSLRVQNPGTNWITHRPSWASCSHGTAPLIIWNLETWRFGSKPWLWLVASRSSVYCDLWPLTSTRPFPPAPHSIFTLFPGLDSVNKRYAGENSSKSAFFFSIKFLRPFWPATALTTFMFFLFFFHLHVQVEPTWLHRSLPLISFLYHLEPEPHSAFRLASLTVLIIRKWKHNHFIDFL